MAAKGFGLKITGTAIVAKNAAKFATQFKSALADEFKRVGILVLNDAKTMCPVDTGRLRSSITMNWTGSGYAHAPIQNPSTSSRNPSKSTDSIRVPTGGAIGEFVVVVGTNVIYAESVHRWAPFLSAAYYNHQNEIKTRYKAIWTKATGRKP